MLAAKAQSGTRTHDFFQDATIDDLRLAAMFRRGFRQAMIQINRSLAQHDLSPLQYHLLLEAGAAGTEGCVQGDLAELIQAPEARVSLMVHELNARGLVRTLRCAPDRRMVRVGLTEAGCRVVEAALHAQRAALHRDGGWTSTCRGWRRCFAARCSYTSGSTLPRKAASNTAPTRSA